MVHSSGDRRIRTNPVVGCVEPPLVLARQAFVPQGKRVATRVWKVRASFLVRRFRVDTKNTANTKSTMGATHIDTGVFLCQIHCSTRKNGMCVVFRGVAFPECDVYSGHISLLLLFANICVAQRQDCPNRIPVTSLHPEIHVFTHRPRVCFFY